MLGTACKTFVVKDVNYSHQLESVLTPDENGDIHDVRHGLTFNVAPFQQQEFGDTDSTQIQEIRLIRDAKGYYFITANQFKHVYVMKPGAGTLKMEKKIKVSDDRLEAPALNFRNNTVQLVKTETNEIFVLTEDGIQENKTKEEQS
jgi:hypothetical protein